MTIGQIISTCPAPVSTVSGTGDALAWLALAAAFADENIGKDSHNYLPIKTDAYIYFNDIKSTDTTYDSINDKLYHIKDMCIAIQSLT